MADDATVPVADGRGGNIPPPSQVRQWGTLRRLSSIHWYEDALAIRSFERMPWLAVVMLVGICAWFALPGPGEWLVFSGICGLCAGLTMLFANAERYPYLRNALLSLAIVILAGMAIIWARSSLSGAPAIGHPIVKEITVRVLEREEDPARDRVRLLVATDDATDRTIRARISVSEEFDLPELRQDTVARMRVRLIAPNRATVPGAYDFARRAWFEGLSAKGSVLSSPEILSTGPAASAGGLRTSLASHVRGRIDTAGGSASVAAIAATLLSGDRGGMARDDSRAMRDAGLAHLLSISGLHVGAVIAIVWFAVMRVLPLWPWLALQVPLPLVAAGSGAAAGLGYTLLTGAELPTVRACIAAMLVLTAMALGRQALSMRLIAIAAIAVMLFWPESVIGPSFQLSFAAVVAIVALHNAPAVERWREQARDWGAMRRILFAAGLLFLTGLVIELALMPLVLFHFHRAGIYGAAANLIAIPLTTLAVMPLLGLALLADLVGLGQPVWWLAARTIELLLEIARTTAASPGAVKAAPLVPPSLLAVIVAGGLWLALWSGRGRLLGLIPMTFGAFALLTLAPPDVLVSADGYNVALRGKGGEVYLLRTSDSYARDAMLEVMGVRSEQAERSIKSIDQWPSARCNADFCYLSGGSDKNLTSILVARQRSNADPQSLAAACAQSDLVISEQSLPEACRPRWLKLDGFLLSRRGGAALSLSDRTVRYVRPARDRHGW